MGEEGDLRRGVALAAHLASATWQTVSTSFGIGEGIGDIEEQHVHARIGQHLQVLPMHPGVVAEEVADGRLAPPVERARAAEGVVGGVGDDLRVVEGAVGAVLAVPEEVEDADIAVAAPRAGVGGGGGRAAQGIGGDPGVSGEIARGGRREASAPWRGG